MTERAEAAGGPDAGEALDREAVDRAALDREAEERDALARVAAGDAEAFALVVERHQERLLRVCRRMLGDPEAARDAAQEVFLKAFRNAGRYKPRGKVYTWLYRIAVNHCLNRLRRRRVVRFLPWSGLGGSGDPGGADDAPAFDPPGDEPDADRRLAARQRWRRVQRALAELPDTQRAVVVLVRFEGLSYKETAEVLGVSLGAVESRLFRAMRNLESALVEEGADR